MDLLSFQKAFFKVTIPFSSVSENFPPGPKRRRLISLVEAAIHFDTWEGLTLLVARLGLAPFPYSSSPLKKAIENLENLSERLSSRGDLKRSIVVSSIPLF